MAARALRLLAVAALLAALAAVPAAAGASGTPARDAVTIYFFWGDGCPHCAAIEPFLEELAARDGVELVAYEVFNDAGNRELFARVADAYDVDADGVPAVFVAGSAWIGDSETNRAAIASTVETCLAETCTDVAGAVVGGRAPPEVIPEPDEESETGGTVIDVPLLGSHDVGGDSLVWATALIAFVDGFNPCSLWVLTILIAMILRTGSRARLTVIGGTYVTTVALVYGLFLVGLFSALSVLDYDWWIRISVAIFALGFAAVNLKDFVWFGRGVSFTIPDRFKPRIARGAHSLAFENRRLPFVVGATAVLAAGVSLLELPCTVGFPVVWTNLLDTHGVGNAEYAFLLAVYLVIFLLDEIAILVAAIAAMRIRRVEEAQGRVLKLVGGMLMAVLGVVMLVDPNLLQDATGAVLAFMAAALLAATALFVRRGVDRRRRATGRVPAPRGKPAHRSR